MNWILGFLLILTALTVPTGAWAESSLEATGYESILEPVGDEVPWEDSNDSQSQGFLEDDIVHTSYYDFCFHRNRNFVVFHIFQYAEPFLQKQIRPPRA